VFESSPRAGLDSGDIVVLLAGHDDEIGAARPYVVTQTDADDGHGPLYRFVVDADSGRNANRHRPAETVAARAPRGGRGPGRLRRVPRADG
jgi:hypothetical protein